MFRKLKEEQYVNIDKFMTVTVTENGNDGFKLVGVTSELKKVVLLVSDKQTCVKKMNDLLGITDSCQQVLGL